MTVELLKTLSFISYMIAIAFILIGIILFFVFHVPKLYCDISGRTAKKAIDAIRKQNESTGNKAYKPSVVNAERGKLTDKIDENGEIQKSFLDTSINVGTEKLCNSPMYSNSGDTTILSNNVLNGENLSEHSDDIKVASEDACKETQLEVEICFAESEEIIE